jgi:hypothetical protein
MCPQHMPGTQEVLSKYQTVLGNNLSRGSPLRTQLPQPLAWRAAFSLLLQISSGWTEFNVWLSWLKSIIHDPGQNSPEWDSWTHVGTKNGWDLGRPGPPLTFKTRFGNPGKIT